jgi:septum site-determining protein MinC
MINIKSKGLLVLTIELEGDDWEQIKKQLDETFERNFFKSHKGIPFVVQPKEGVGEETVKKVIDYLISKGLKPLLYPEGEKKTAPQIKATDLEKIESPKVKIINRNIRSGQLVEHGGDVLIIGDVNPGAEIRAAGNIIVMGALKGIAWAGYPGNKDAVVVALKMQPQQLRIGNIIATTDGEVLKGDKPEVAKIVDGEIVLEPLV